MQINLGYFCMGCNSFWCLFPLRKWQSQGAESCCWILQYICDPGTDCLWMESERLAARCRDAGYTIADSHSSVYELSCRCHDATRSFKRCHTIFPALLLLPVSAYSDLWICFITCPRHRRSPLSGLIFEDKSYRLSLQLHQTASQNSTRPRKISGLRAETTGKRGLCTLQGFHCAQTLVPDIAEHLAKSSLKNPYRNRKHTK